MSTLFFVGLIFLAYYLISKDVFTINFDNFQQKRVFTTIDAEFIAALLAKIAKADDVVSEKEANYISNVLDMVCAELNDYSYRDHLKYIYNYHKDSDVKIFNLAMEFKIKRNLSIAECTSVIIYLLNLAYIDGTFKRTEREAIETVCDAFEINDRLKEKIFADFKREFYSTYNSYERDNPYNRQEQRHERHEEQRYYKATLNKDPYEILGLPKTASFDEIKKQYRKLAREYHPDFLGSSAEKSVISEATKKLQEINQAYEELKKKFGQ